MRPYATGAGLRLLLHPRRQRHLRAHAQRDRQGRRRQCAGERDDRGLRRGPDGCARRAGEQSRGNPHRSERRDQRPESRRRGRRIRRGLVGDQERLRPYATGTGSGFSFTPDDNGTYVVTLSATDKDGGVSAPASTTIVVFDVAPTAAIAGPPASSPEGSPIALTGVVTDPSPVDVAAGFAEAWTVTKNGSPLATGTGSGFSFTPDDNGNYIVTLSATDKDGGVSAPASTTIVVFDVAPTAAIASPPASSPEGSPIALTGVVTDPSPVDVAAGFAEAWTVTKNGSPLATGTGSGFSFTPDDNGNYTVTLSATDKDGGVSAPASTTIVVFDVAPTAAIASPPASSPEGSPIALTGVVTDPSSVDVAAGFAEAWTVTKNGSPLRHRNRLRLLVHTRRQRQLHRHAQRDRQGRRRQRTGEHDDRGLRRGPDGGHRQSAGQQS